VTTTNLLRRTHVTRELRGIDSLFVHFLRSSRHSGVWLTVRRVAQVRTRGWLQNVVHDIVADSTNTAGATPTLLHAAVSRCAFALSTSSYFPGMLL
jgi:hypothetical protein